MTHPYTISGPALADLGEVRDYYLGVAGEQVANRMLERIYDRFRLIAEYPYIGMARPEYGEGFRTYRPPNTPYVIGYLLRGDIVEITHVVHGRRNMGRLFG